MDNKIFSDSLNTIQVLNNLILNCGDAEYKDVYEKIKLTFIPMNIINFNAGNYFLFRARSHDPFDKYFKHEDEISFRRDYNDIKIGRANFPNQSIFYSSNNADASLFEIGKFSRLNNCFEN